jgi:hypothetical protein
MPLDLFERESNNMNKLLGAAAMAAVVVFAVAPASAAKHAMGCGSDNQANVENMVEAMPDGDSKTMARKEIVEAQNALLDGHMGACGMHLNKAEHIGAMK